MLIGIDARYGFRKQRRGIGVYIYNLLEQFKSAKGFRYILYVDDLADQAIIEKFTQPPFTIRQIKGCNLICWEQVLLPIMAKRDRLDILHCTSNITPLIKVCPTIVTILDVIEFRRAAFGDTRLTLRHRLSRLYRVSLLPALANKADLIITISEFSRQDIIDVLKISPDKILTIYLGFPVKPYIDAGFSRQTEKFILALGAMDNRKNLKVLFEAFYLYKKDVSSNTRLIIVGVEKPGLFIKEHDLTNHPFYQNISCRGFVGDDELMQLYRQCACFVYPSLYEGFGLPPLEAMAAGAPVIASSTTSVGEIVDNAGLLFNPIKPFDLAEKIRLIMENPALSQELREKGRERVKFFSWEKCARETLDAYGKIYSSNRVWQEKPKI